MKKSMIIGGVTCFLFWATCLDAQCQRLIAEIEFDKRLIGAKVFPFGDSVLLSFRQSASKDKTVEYWINSQGVVSSSEVATTNSAFQFATFLKVFDGEIYMYRLNIALGKRFFELGANGSFSVDDRIELTGEVLAVFNKEKILVVTYEKKFNLIKVIQVEKKEIIKEQIYSVPFDLSRLNIKSAFQYDDDKYNNLSECSATLKITLAEDVITILIDEPYKPWFDEENHLAKTIIYKINLSTNKTEIQSILEPSKDYFYSCLFNEKLYRATSRSNRLELQIFDINSGSRVSSHMIFKTFDGKTQFVTERIGKENKISRNQTLSKFFNWIDKGKPFVHCEETSGHQTVVIWGSYFNAKTLPVPSGTSVTPSAIFLDVATKAMIFQHWKDPDVSRYFYLLESETNYQYATEVGSLTRSKIDSYEIQEQNNGTRYRMKAYANLGDFTLGLYVKEKSNKIQIIKFDTQSN